ncbi:hypothetical protein JCM13304A_14230 [Desulfothermus okinawensis JCM 13304]
MVRFKVVDIARVFGVHRNTITNWIRKGTLNAKPIVGRKYVISEERLRAFARENNVSDEIINSFIEKNRVQDKFIEDKILGDKKVKNEIIDVFQPATKERKENMHEHKTVGSVLVLGGGIAGIQTVLDLADSGYFVHLVERSAGIGGVMAQLDKTFPTNDCAM